MVITEEEVNGDEEGLDISGQYGTPSSPPTVTTMTAAGYTTAQATQMAPLMPLAPQVMPQPVPDLSYSSSEDEDFFDAEDNAPEG